MSDLSDERAKAMQALLDDLRNSILEFRTISILTGGLCNPAEWCAVSTDGEPVNVKNLHALVMNCLARAECEWDAVMQLPGVFGEQAAIPAELQLLGLTATKPTGMVN